MSRRRALIVVVALGCGGNAAKPAREDSSAPSREAPAAKPPLELPDGGTSLRLIQRTSADLPGSGGSYTIAIDDITRGQVGITIGRQNGSAVLVSKSARPSQSVAFAIGEYRYEVVVEALDNKLIGDDSAKLLVRAAAGAPPAQALAAPPPGLTENERIEALIGVVATSGIVFIRNGSEHSASDAAEHLRTKWSRAGDRIATAESFIDQLGSKSSTSGDPYRVRLSDGTERDAGPWLHEQLEALAAK